MKNLDSQLEPSERQILLSLDSPARIQAFLDDIPYSEDKFYRCPLRVLRERKAHCFDGALFAAMALRRLGYPPLIMELLPNDRDDDHLLALFKPRLHWGAVSKSNFTGLRYREPVYRSLRELAMTYFEHFFNTVGEKTMRAYRRPVNLNVFDPLDWMCNDAGLEALSDGLDRYQVFPVLTDKMAAALALVDERNLQAGLMGANWEGLFKVPRS